MPGSKPAAVELTADGRDELAGLIRRHKTGQLADRARIVALACEAPGQCGRPISQWSTTELAAEIMRRGIVETISPRHAARLLKWGTSGRT